MTTFSSDKVTQKTVTTYPNGVAKTTYAYVTTQAIVTNWKIADKEPPFVANQFLIKDYEVGSTTFEAEKLYLKLPTYTRSDGVKIDCSLTGPLNNIARSLLKIDQRYVDLSALKRLAVQEAHGKLLGVEWDLGVDLAEVKETIGLLPSLFKKAAYSVNKALAKRNQPVKSGGKRGSKLSGTGKALESLSNEVSDLWLIGRYGVMPIIMSIQDALELLKKQLEKADKRICTKRRRLSKVVSETKNHYDISGLCTRVHYHHDCRVEGVVYYRRVMDQSMQQALGLLPERIPSIAWELVSRSFVWDWFFNVGTFLDYLQPKFDVEILGSSYSEKQIAAHAVMTEYQTPQGGYRSFSQDTVFHRQRFKRTANPSDIGQLAFTGLDRMSLLRDLDAAALAFKPLLKAAKALFRK